MNRKEIYDKYNGHCAYCGKKIDIKEMQIDHFISKCVGGTDDNNNLMPACRRCNHYKRANSLEAFREAIETIPQKLMERNYIFKVGVDYGFFQSERRNVKFYFEKEETEK